MVKKRLVTCKDMVCPECDSDNVEETGSESEYNYRMEQQEDSVNFKCNDCGCEYTVTRIEIIKYEYETEVNEHGNKNLKSEK